MTIKDEHMNTALVAADPSLKIYHASIARVIADGGQPTKATYEHVDYLERCARVKVRRVVAALCGWDIERLCSPSVDSEGEMGVVMLSRDMVDKLKTALLNEAVAKALDQVIGVEAAGTLMGEIAVL